MCMKYMWRAKANLPAGLGDGVMDRGRRRWDEERGGGGGRKERRLREAGVWS